MFNLDEVSHEISNESSGVTPNPPDFGRPKIKNPSLDVDVNDFSDRSLNSSPDVVWLDAPIAWAQRENLVFLTIELDSSVTIEELKITATSINFRGTTPNVNYGCTFYFYDNVKSYKRSYNSRSIEIAIQKSKCEWWPRLMSSVSNVPWLKVDYGRSKVEAGEGPAEPNAAAIPTYLSATFPKLPEEIREYVFAVLKENAEDLSSVDEVVEAVGDHLQASTPDLKDERCRDICERLIRLLHGDNLPVAPNTRKLEETIDMAAQQTNFKAMESIWKVQTREAPSTAVDHKKLKRAENQAAAKQAERAGVEPTARRKRPEVTATASQAANRNINLNTAIKDVKLEQVDISFGTKMLLQSAEIMMAFGRRYGLVGRNGIGKTTLLKMISAGQLQIPKQISMLSVEQEVEGDDTSVLDAVLASDVRRSEALEKEKMVQERINRPNMSEEERNKYSDQLNKLYIEMESLGLDKAPARAAGILYGLGFTPDEQKKPTKEFSGGWRMRVALARALFVKPDLLLLDEPTNMLDMRAVYWLEGHLQDWEGTILTVSHDRKFLNEICTDIVHLHTRRLDHYKGNYDNFEKTMTEKLSQQQREFEAQQQLRAHTQEFIDKFRYNAKRAAMVQSRIKMLERLPVLHAVEFESEVHFRFPDCESVGNPVLQLDEVAFRYNPDSPYLFRKLNLGTHENSRICIVGENGAGKTTLLKLLLGEHEPTTGMRNVNRRLRIGYFTQHHVDQLDLDMSAIEVLAHKNPGKTQEDYRAALGRFGLSGDVALQAVYSLSGGQKSRLAFANLALMNPNYLILDEPTNHLDVETVEALGKALTKFTGGVVLVSHDERLIELVCKELWVVKDRMVTNLEGGLDEYRKQVYKQLQLAA